MIGVLVMRQNFSARAAYSSIFSMLLLCVSWSCALGRTWTVEVGGTGDAPTIQAAIDSSASGDSIAVWPGTYNENLDMRGKTLVLRGVLGADVTIVDGGNQGRVLAVSDGVVEGLTLQRGFCFCEGAGVYVVAAATIRNCTIQNNRSGTGPETGVGGGVFFEIFAFGAVLEYSVIRNNSAGGPGGGLYDNGQLTEVRDCAFISNSAVYGGGGMYLNGTVVERCLVSRNFSNIGTGGIEGNYSSRIRYNTIVYNRTTGQVGGIGAFGPSVVSHNIVAFNTPGAGLGFVGSPTPTCNVLWQNQVNAIGWSGTGNGNATVDPLFCNAANNDFTLQDNSPCLAANNPSCGLIGALPRGCGSTAVQDQSWSGVKQMFR